MPVIPIPFSEALRVWIRVGLQSFGGPAGQIAVMHRILVDEKKWIGDSRFVHALNYCMLLPGPEAQQLATYIGWLLHGTRGGLAAGLLFVLPGFLSILGLSVIYVAAGHVPVVAGIFFGLKAAVLALVMQALVRIATRILKNRVMLALAVASFCALFVFSAPFPLVIAAAAVAGIVGSRLSPGAFRVNAHGAAKGTAVSVGVLDELLNQGTPERMRPSWKGTARVVACCGLLWILPFAIFGSLGQGFQIYITEATFFSKAAVVTFGGAYAVLSYMAQEAVHRYAWLTPAQMMDGLGLAETTPGPLIMVAQFVGFMGAYHNPGTLSPLLAGVIGAVVTTWVTFVPCFLWIFAGAPYVEALRRNEKLSAALSAITAAVVGVIANLALWFSLHVLFREVTSVHWLGGTLAMPRLASIDIASSVIAASALVAALKFKVKFTWLLLGAAAAGLVFTLLA
jgi:chromate transporter